ELVRDARARLAGVLGAGAAARAVGVADAVHALAGAERRAHGAGAARLAAVGRRLLAAARRAAGAARAFVGQVRAVDGRKVAFAGRQIGSAALRAQVGRRLALVVAAAGHRTRVGRRVDRRRLDEGVGRRAAHDAGVGRPDGNAGIDRRPATLVVGAARVAGRA